MCMLNTTNFSEKPTSHISSIRAAAGWTSSCCYADTNHRSSSAFITRAVVAHELPHGTKFGAAGTTIVAANLDSLIHPRYFIRFGSNDDGPSGSKFGTVG